MSSIAVLRLSRTPFCLLFLFIATIAFAEPVRVGEFGDLQRLRVAGVKTINANEVATALAGDLEVVLASHPSARYSEYLTALNRRSRSAFLHQGFPDVRVAARFDEATGNTTVTIEEGSRFTAGQLKISGARQVNVTKLQQILQRDGPILQSPLEGKASDAESKGSTDVEGPLWEISQPIRFSEKANAKRERIVKAALAELGFHNCNFKCEIVRHANQQRGDLHVTILDEGRPAIVDDFTVTGLQLNQRADFLRELGWRSGRAVALSDLRRMDEKLRASGRFISHDVHLVPPIAEGDAFRLHAEVLEYPYVTPLGKPLSDIEQVLLKFHRWASEFDHRGQDMVVHLKNEEGVFDAVFSPEHGAVATVKRILPKNDISTKKHTIAFTAQDIGYYVDGLDRYLSVGNSPLQVKVSLAFKLSDGEERDERPSSFNFGFGLKTREADEPPVAFELDFTPAFFLARAYSHGAKCRIEDGVLTIDSQREYVQLDVTSGKPIKFIIKDEDGKELGTVTLTHGALQKRLIRLRKGREAANNVYDTTRPISSVAEFLLNEELHREFAAFNGLKLPDEQRWIRPEVQRVLKRLFALDALRALDQLAINMASVDEDETDTDLFTIGPPSSAWQGKRIGIAQQYAHLMLPFSDQLFERHTWPWTLYRETCLTIAGEGKHTGQELEKLVSSPSTGPFCLLVTSELLGIVSADAKRTIATVGLQRMSVGDFRNEYDVLLNREFIIGKTVFRIAEILAQLSEEETKLLGELFSDDGGEFARGTKKLREERAYPLGDILPIVLDELWNELLAAHVKKALEARTQ